MKKKFIILASVLLLAACGKESQPIENTVVADITNSERDIFYTVAENASIAIIAGNDTSVHLSTEAEWDALLDHFCDQAADGNQVVFCPSGQPRANGAAKDTPTTISTDNREELKTWMKEMEKAGKTVIVTYDEEDGRWRGRAYEKLMPTAAEAVVQDYSGDLIFIPTPSMQGSALGGLVWAMRIDSGDTLVFTVEGMMLWFDCETPDATMTLLQRPATMRGVASSHTDGNGATIQTLELEIPEDGVIAF